MNSKDKVIDYLQLKIMANTNKNWEIDYAGNGTIQPGVSASTSTAAKITQASLSKPIDKQQSVPTTKSEKED